MHEADIHESVPGHLVRGESVSNDNPLIVRGDPDGQTPQRHVARRHDERKCGHRQKDPQACEIRRRGERPPLRPRPPTQRQPKRLIARHVSSPEMSLMPWGLLPGSAGEYRLAPHLGMCGPIDPPIPVAVFVDGEWRPALATWRQHRDEDGGTTSPGTTVHRRTRTSTGTDTRTRCASGMSEVVSGALAGQHRKLLAARCRHLA